MSDRDCIHGSLARSCDRCEMLARIAELEAALRPFAIFYSMRSTMHMRRAQDHWRNSGLTVGDFRRAAALLAEIRKESLLGPRRREETRCDVCHDRGEILAPCPPDCADGDKDYPCDMGHYQPCPNPNCKKEPPHA